MIDYKHKRKVRQFKDSMEIVGGTLILCALLSSVYCVLILIANGVI